MASRILGMGDVLSSLIEKAEQGLDSQETERLAKRFVSQEFTLEDLRKMMKGVQSKWLRRAMGGNMDGMSGMDGLDGLGGM